MGRTEFKRKREPLSMFMRKSVNSETGEQTLETAIATYENERNGNTITLVSTVHLGSPEYYATIQQALDAHADVFYEGINRKEGPARWYQKLSPAGAFAAAQKYLTRLWQKRMRLDHQNDRLVTRSNWRNRDVTANAFLKDLNHGGKTAFFSRMANYARLYTYAAVSVLLSQVLRLGNDRQVREIFVDVAMDHIPEYGDRTILAYRNDLATDHMRQWSQTNAHRTLGINYGAGHQLHFQKYLTERLGYELKDVQWARVF